MYVNTEVNLVKHLQFLSVILLIFASTCLGGKAVVRIHGYWKQISSLTTFFQQDYLQNTMSKNNNWIIIKVTNLSFCLATKNISSTLRQLAVGSDNNCTSFDVQHYALKSRRKASESRMDEPNASWEAFQWFVLTKIYQSRRKIVRNEIISIRSCLKCIIKVIDLKKKSNAGTIYLQKAVSKIISNSNKSSIKQLTQFLNQFKKLQEILFCIKQKR